MKPIQDRIIKPQTEGKGVKEKNCGNCKWCVFKIIKGSWQVRDREVLFCHFLPPTILQGLDIDVSARPEVKNIDFCSKWISKPVNN